METASLDILASEISAAAEQVGAYIINSLLSSDSKNIIIAPLDGEKFPGFIRQVRPKIVYLFATPFDASDEIETSFEDEGEELLELKSVKKLIANWRAKKGETCRVLVSVMCDGILHMASETADWLADFEVQAEAIVAEIQQSEAEQANTYQLEKRKIIKAKVKELMADPRFNGPKVGIAKRKTLAETLFPDLDAELIREIVDQAEQEHWLLTATK